MYFKYILDFKDSVKKKVQYVLVIFKWITYSNNIFDILDQVKYIIKVYSNGYFLHFVMWLWERFNCPLLLALYFCWTVLLWMITLVA